jgi:phosphoribosylglycinamide formyltransferase-1
VTLALGILVSGSGSNMEAILTAIAEKRLDAECKIVISNRPDVLALRRASSAGVKTAVLDHKLYDSRERFDMELVSTLRAEGVEWIALAGFMRVLTPVFLDAFAKKVVNIHPSLLPAFPGVSAQNQAFEYGVKITGCTAHFVDGGVDTGPIILQSAVPVLPADTAESLKARILEQEHQIFVEALQKIARGEVVYPEDGRRIAAPRPQ